MLSTSPARPAPSSPPPSATSVAKKFVGGSCFSSPTTTTCVPRTSEPKASTGPHLAGFVEDDEVEGQRARRQEVGHGQRTHHEHGLQPLRRSSRLEQQVAHRQPSRLLVHLSRDDREPGVAVSSCGQGEAVLVGEPRAVVHELARVEIRELLDRRLVRFPGELPQGLALGEGSLDEMRVPGAEHGGVEVPRRQAPIVPRAPRRRRARDRMHRAAAALKAARSSRRSRSLRHASTHSWSASNVEPLGDGLRADFAHSMRSAEPRSSSVDAKLAKQGGEAGMLRAEPARRPAPDPPARRRFLGDGVGSGAGRLLALTAGR